MMQGILEAALEEIKKEMREEVDRQSFALNATMDLKEERIQKRLRRIEAALGLSLKGEDDDS